METRSFADYLRTLDDAALISLFSHRPDLVTPVPPDVASLAVRASSAPSLARAIDALNAWQYQVLEACAIAPEPFTEKVIAALTDKAALFVIPGLLERGLIFQGKDGYYLPTTVREVLGNEIQGLGPQTVVKLNFKKLDEAPPAAKKALEAMVWGPPRGTVADVKKPGAGVAWLLENNFVVAANTKTVLLVREVALAIRGGKLHKELNVQAPDLQIEKRDLKSVQLAAIAKNPGSEATES